MEATTNLIFDFELVHVAMTNFNSGTMEREGLRNLLTRLDDAPFNISQVATDRSAQIKAMMRDDFGHIAHQFDVWHFAKSIVKKLTKATTKKEMEMLRNWIPSISNHLWWCSQTCGGSSTIRVEKWVSLVHHIANKHAWVDAKHFMACEHECLTEDESRQWLSPGSEQHQALTKIVTDKTVLQDIEKFTDFSHTGERNYYGVWHASIHPRCRAHASYAWRCLCHERDHPASSAPTPHARSSRTRLMISLIVNTTRQLYKFLLHYFRVSKSTMKTCEHLKVLFSSFSPTWQISVSEAVNRNILNRESYHILRLPGAEVLCARGRGMIWQGTAAVRPGHVSRDINPPPPPPPLLFVHHADHTSIQPSTCIYLT